MGNGNNFNFNSLSCNKGYRLYDYLNDRHRNKKGHKLSAYIVQKYGAYLRPSLYEHINIKPLTRQQALIMEEKLALDLRRQGYAVWSN